MENQLIQTNIDYDEFWNTSDVTYYTFRRYLRANDVKSIRYRDADCWCPQHPSHHPGICDQLPPPGAGIGSHSDPDHHYPGAATGNEKSEPMISSSDGGPVMAMEQFVVQSSDRGETLAQLQLPQKRLKSSIVGAWQSVQKALRNEIQIEI